MKGILNFWLVAGMFLLAPACKKDKPDCFKSTGDLVREQREVGGFSTMEIYNNVNVVISQDTLNQVVIEAGENLLKKITTEVKGAALVIRNENKCNWVRSYKKEINAYVSVKDLTKIGLFGHGKITSSNTITTPVFFITNKGNGDVELQVDNGYCYIDLHSAGDLILTGKIGGIEIWTSGNNWVRCLGLKTSYAALYTHTTGDCFLTFDDSLNIVLAGWEMLFTAAILKK